jgi:hypothetical protein
MINILDKELGSDNYTLLQRRYRGFQVKNKVGAYHNISSILESKQADLLDDFYDEVDAYRLYLANDVIIVFKNIADKVLYDLTDGYGYFTNERTRSSVFETN